MLGSHVQSVFKNNQIVRTPAIELTQHLHRYATYRQPRTAAQREVVQNHSPFAIHRKPVEQRRVCTVYRPANGTDIPFYRHLSQLSRRSAHVRSEEHTSELQSRQYLVCRLLLEKKKIT